MKTLPLTSRTLNVSVALAAGFAAGYAATYFSLNPRHEAFDSIAYLTAAACAAVNAARQLLISKEQNARDRHAFLCWGLAAGAIVLGINGHHLGSTITATLAGGAGVLIRRKCNATAIAGLEKGFAKGAVVVGLFGYIITTSPAHGAWSALAGGITSGTFTAFRTWKKAYE